MDQVTFCIQGPMTGNSGDRTTYAKRLHDSIRRYFSGARVIVSSWEGEQEQEFQGPDQFVYSQDPGSGARYLTGERNNVNRQIVSTRAGLARVQTRYAVKLRSDLLFVHGKLSKLFELAEASHKAPWSIMTGRMLVLDRQTYSPLKYAAGGLALHVSDHFQFGLAEDLKKFWNMPMMSDSDEAYFRPLAELHPNRAIHIPRWRAEQYFWMQNLSRTLEVDLSTSKWDDLGAHLPTPSEIFFRDNLVPLKSSTLGLRSQKYKWSIMNDLVTSTYAFTYEDWRKLVRENGKHGAADPKRIFWEQVCSFYSQGLGARRSLLRFRRSR